MDNPASPTATPQESAQALQNLVSYIAVANTPDLMLLLRSRGIAPQAYDLASLQSATMQMLSMGSAKESEQALTELLRIHPDSDVILQVYGKHPAGCDCKSCGGKKEAFFNKDRLFWIVLAILFLVGIYFIEKD